MALQYMVLKILKSSISSKVNLSDADLKTFVLVLWKKNEDIENQEQNVSLVTAIPQSVPSGKNRRMK